MNTKTQFAVPLNWSHAFLDFVLDNRTRIATVYGSIAGEPGGRPLPYAANLSPAQIPNQDKIRRYVSKLLETGVQFNLAFNTSCHGNRIYSESGKDWLRSHIELMRDLEIESVTVSSFDIARRISHFAPSIKITLSVMFNITTIDAISYALKQDFNLAGVVVGKGIMRRIPLLKSLLKFASNHGIQAILIANDFCPSGNCPERMSDHNNSCAHFHSTPEEYVSPSIHCRRMAMHEPAHFLQAPVIYPHEVDYYHALGAHHFKLTDRVMPDEVLMNVCQAYFSGDYLGNLFDLFTYTSYLGQETKINIESLRLSDTQLAEIYLNGYSKFKEYRMNFICKPTMTKTQLIKSRFFDFFDKGKCTMECGSRVREIVGCLYCEEKSKNLISYNNEAWSAVLSNIERYIMITRLSKGEIETLYRQPKKIQEANQMLVNQSYIAKKNKAIYCFLLDYGIHWDCNLACGYCRTKSKRSTGQIKKEELVDKYILGLEISTDYVDAVMFKTSGWGEITTVPGYEKLLLRAIDLGYPIIQLITNGLNIPDNSTLTLLCERSSFSVQLSLDGIHTDSLEHRFQGNNKVLEHVLENLNVLLRFGIPVEINSVLTSGNISKFSKLLEYLIRLNERYDVPLICVPRPVRVKRTLANFNNIPKAYEVADFKNRVLDCYQIYRPVLPAIEYMKGVVSCLSMNHREWIAYDTLIRTNIGSEGDIVYHTTSGTRKLGSIFSEDPCTVFERRKNLSSYIGDKDYQAKLNQFDIHSLYLGGIISDEEIARIPSCRSVVAMKRLRRLKCDVDMVKS